MFIYKLLLGWASFSSVSLRAVIRTIILTKADQRGLTAGLALKFVDVRLDVTAGRGMFIPTVFIVPLSMTSNMVVDI